MDSYKIKRLIAILITCILGITSLGLVPVHGDSTDTMEAYANAIFGAEFMQNQRHALEIAEQLHSTFPQDRIGRTIFPDSFGGMYINTDGNLVVLLAETTEHTPLDGSDNRNIDEKLGFYGLNNRIEWRNTEFSYYDLNETLELAALTWRERRDTLGCRYSFNVSGAGINAQMNRVVIGLVEYNYEMIAGFRRYVLDSQHIVFEQRYRAEFPIPPSYASFQDAHMGNSCDYAKYYCVSSIPQTISEKAQQRSFGKR